MNIKKSLGSPVITLAPQALGGKVKTRKLPSSQVAINLNSPRNFQFHTGKLKWRCDTRTRARSTALQGGYCV